MKQQRASQAWIILWYITCTKAVLLYLQNQTRYWAQCKWGVSRGSQRDSMCLKTPSERPDYFILPRESNGLSHLPFSLLWRGRLRKRTRRQESPFEKSSIYKHLFYLAFSFPEHQMSCAWESHFHVSAHVWWTINTSVLIFFWTFCSNSRQH